MRDNLSRTNPRQASSIRWMVVLVCLIFIIIAVWTEQTQHMTLQEKSRSITLKQLSAALSSLMRDRPESLQFLREAQMIGSEHGQAFCPSLGREIVVNPQLASIVDPYLHKIDYDAAMTDPRWSGWYLQFEDKDLVVGSCISSSKRELITR